MSYTDVKINELKRAGLFDTDSDYGGMIGEAVKELLLVFGSQGHSGYSAKLVSELFFKLNNGEVLSPLTDDSLEWMEVTPELFQSRRIPNVFIDKTIGSDPYTLDGKIFSDDGGKSYFTNVESRVSFSLPGYPPKTQYIILGSEE